MATATQPQETHDALLDPGQLERYADAIVHTSLALARGDWLLMQAHPEHRELDVAPTESGTAPAPWALATRPARRPGGNTSRRRRPRSSSPRSRTASANADRLADAGPAGAQ